MNTGWKTLAIKGLLCAAAVASAAGCASPDAASTVSIAESCIDPSRIRKQVVVSDEEIKFELAGGDVWVNKLARKCTGLKFEGGFAWEVRGGSVCSNQQVITVLNSGNTCLLGAFSKVPAAAT